MYLQIIDYPIPGCQKGCVVPYVDNFSRIFLWPLEGEVELVKSVGAKAPGSCPSSCARGPCRCCARRGPPSRWLRKCETIVQRATVLFQ